MSNTEASRVYELIVEAVVNEVREDFENAGIDEQTLQDLKRNWQSKLSETKVTKFSWDDLTTDLSLNNNQHDISSNDATSSNINNNNSAVEFGVKQEDIEQGLVLPGFEGNNTNTHGPNSIPNDNNDTNENVEVKKEEPEQSQEQKEIQSESDVTNPGDNMNNSNININSSNTGRNSSSDQQITLTIDDPSAKTIEQLRLQQEKQAKRSALLDTDEVGSELDDSDDDYLISEGEEDGPDENLMLCLYEKVTRTKARWKCSLKDGVVTINRKDYTFQKAQVEAEWV